MLCTSCHCAVFIVCLCVCLHKCNLHLCINNLDFKLSSSKVRRADCKALVAANLSGVEDIVQLSLPLGIPVVP